MTVYEPGQLLERLKVYIKLLRADDIRQCCVELHRFIIYIHLVTVFWMYAHRDFMQFEWTYCDTCYNICWM